MIITEILARNARMYGNDTALIEREPEKNLRREITWEEFHGQSAALANALMDRGVQKGDKVVQLMTNCIEWLPVYFGILSTGAVAAPLNFRFLAKDILYCARVAQPKVFIFGPEFITRMESVLEDLQKQVGHFLFAGPRDQCPPWARTLEEFVQGASTRPPDVPLDLLDPAGIYFTSGTTGQPKATLLTHRNLEFSCFLENRHHNQTKDDNFLVIPPLYHAGAKMHWFGNFIVGAKAVILKGVKPEWVLEAVSLEGCTVVWLLVPWALDILFAIKSGELKLADYKLSQWRLMHIGAQPVPPSLIQQWLKVFPHHQYDTNYGLTETTGPGCVHLGLENTHKVGAIGRPGFDWETRIVDDEGQIVTNGDPGELWLRGPGIMREYFGNTQATSQVIKDGWLATGDVARMDEDGFLWLVDRKKDVIITGGENIYPVEIEDFLHQHEMVADAAVIGVPSLRLGEIAAAVVQVKPGAQLTKVDLEEFCQGLPRYKRPRRFYFGDVPRNPTGKIEKPKLREIYGGQKESFTV